MKYLRLSSTAEISLGNAVIIIGGWFDNTGQRLISMFKNEIWSSIGYLRIAAHSLNAVHFNNQIYVAGSLIKWVFSI